MKRGGGASLRLLLAAGAFAFDSWIGVVMGWNANAKRTPPLILLGAPGAGKGTQAQVISQALHIPHISTGAIFRQHVQQNTPLGRLAKGMVEQGILVTDEIVNNMVRERLREKDCSHGFLLDGYPRTVAQAEAFRDIIREMGLAKPVVISLQVSYDVIVERLSGRRTCPVCQRTYNIRTSPPRQDEVCDADGTPLEQRADDRPEAIRERLAAYERQTAPLVNFYRNEGSLLEIDGEQPPDAISSTLQRLLAEL
ncbi:MAG TPA: adenylate kinase [Terriglobia bacterium]|nr:adenylate kinase [Terriglobia bacterium]